MGESKTRTERKTYLKTIHEFCYRNVSLVTEDVISLEIAVRPVPELDPEEFAAFWRRSTKKLESEGGSVVSYVDVHSEQSYSCMKLNTHE